MIVIVRINCIKNMNNLYCSITLKPEMRYTLNYEENFFDFMFHLIFNFVIHCCLKAKKPLCHNRLMNGGGGV